MHKLQKISEIVNRKEKTNNCSKLGSRCLLCTTRLSTTTMGLASWSYEYDYPSFLLFPSFPPPSLSPSPSLLSRPPSSWVSATCHWLTLGWTHWRTGVQNSLPIYCNHAFNTSCHTLTTTCRHWAQQNRWAPTPGGHWRCRNAPPE